MHSLKHQAHNFFRPIKNGSSSDFSLLTVKGAVCLQDTISGSEYDSKHTFVDIGSKHDIRKIPGVEVNSPGLEHESRESASGISTASCRTPRVTLQNRPTLTCSLKDETLYEGEPIDQHLPDQAVVGTFNPDNTSIVTPPVHPSPAAMPPPLPSPCQSESRNNDILSICVPKDLGLPFIE